MVKKMAASKRSKRRRRKATSSLSQKRFNFSDPKFQEEFALARAKWRKKVAPLIEAARSSERLTAKDFAVVINV